MDLKITKSANLSFFSRAVSPKINMTDIDVFGSLSREYEAKSVVFAYHGRVVRQKGMEILADSMQFLFSQNAPVVFVICGQGEWTLEDRLISLSEQFPGKIIFFRGYSREASRFITAASDFFVLPSNFEPCGLEDFIAQLFGTIPVAHATGGLQKIVHLQTGFLYQQNDAQTLSQLLLFLAYDFKLNQKKYRGIASYAARYVKTRYSWKHIVPDSYLPLYETLISGRES